MPAVVPPGHVDSCLGPHLPQKPAATAAVSGLGPLLRNANMRAATAAAASGPPCAVAAEASANASMLQLYKAEGKALRGARVKYGFISDCTIIGTALPA